MPDDPTDQTGVFACGPAYDETTVEIVYHIPGDFMAAHRHFENADHAGQAAFLAEIAARGWRHIKTVTTTTHVPGLGDGLRRRDASPNDAVPRDLFAMMAPSDDGSPVGLDHADAP